MTNRVQNFRTPTTGVAPAAGTRLAGELWINFADFQLGMIDASRNAQKLVAVRYFQTTANYAVGEFVIQAGALYVANTAVTAGAFSAPQWTKIATASDLTTAIAGIAVPGPSSTTPAMDGTATIGVATTYARADHIHPSDTSRAPLASPAFTGTPSLPTGTTGVTQTAGDSSTKLATTAFVSAMPVAIGDNRIINGDMRITQRGASGTAAQYTVDRWSFGASLATKGTWSQQANVPQPSDGFPYSLTFVSNSSYSAVAADQFLFAQPIEADQISDFQFGTANAKPVTLSFWAYASVSGSFSGAIQNYAQTRSYPFSYSVPAANTWTKIAVTIPGDTSGTWVMSGNAGSCFVIFDLGSGATFRGPASAWASATYNGVTGAKSIVATNGATFYVTGVKLEIGSIATPYNRQSLAKSMADCQRYYQTISVSARFWATAGAQLMDTAAGFQTMRAAPTGALISSPTHANVTSSTLNPFLPNSGSFEIVATAVGDAYNLNVIYSLSAEL